MKIPVYNQQAQLGGLPGVRQDINVNASNFLGETDATFGKLAAESAQTLDKAATHIYSQQLHEARTTQATAGANQLDMYDTDAEQEWRNQRGDQVLTQENSQPLPVNVLSARQQKANEIADSMQDPEARRMFQEYANKSARNVYAQVSGHETQQIYEYKVNTLQSAIDGKINRLQKNYNDPVLFREGIQQIDAFSQQLGQITGKGSEWAKAHALGHISNAIQASTGAALQNGDYHTAQTILNQYGDLMTPLDRLNAQGKISNDAAEVMLQTDPQKLYDKMSIPHDEELMLKLENGTDEIDANGQPKRSSDGLSIGRYQVTDKTAHAPGFGIQPVKDDSLAERNRVGHELWGKLREKYQGDIFKMAAAYNAGDGRVDKAIKKGGDNWRDLLPAITKNQHLPRLEKLIASDTDPLNKLPEHDRVRIANQAKARMNQGQYALAAALDVTVDNQLRAHMDKGTQIDLQNPAAFQQAYGEEKGQVKYQEYLHNVNYAKDFYAIKDLPYSEQVAKLSEIEPKEGATDYAIRAEEHDKLSKMIAMSQAERAKDPAAYTDKMGFTQPLPQSLTQAADLIAQRIKPTEIAAEKYQIPFNLLTKDTAMQYQAQLKSMTPDIKAKTLGELSSKIQDRGAFFKLMQQIAPDSPVTTMAAGMMAFPGKAETAATMLRGERMLNVDKGDKKEDGKPTTLPIPNDVTFKQKILSQLNGAYVGEGVDAAKRFENNYQAIRAYYTARAFETRDISADPAYINGKLLDEAVQNVTGGIANYGSGKTAYVPWGMDANKFEEQAPVKIFQALERAGYDKTDWKNYDLMELDNGLYQLGIKGRTVPGAIVDFR